MDRDIWVRKLYPNPGNRLRKNDPRIQLHSPPKLVMTFAQVNPPSKPPKRAKQNQSSSQPSRRTPSIRRCGTFSRGCVKRPLRKLKRRCSRFLEGLIKRSKKIHLSRYSWEYTIQHLWRGSCMHCSI